MTVALPNVRRRAPVRVVCALLLLALPAAAQETGCDRPETSSQVASCSWEAMAAADDALEATYAEAFALAQGLISEPGETPVAELIAESQELWEAYRGTACRAEAHIGGPQVMGDILSFDCRARMAEERRAALDLFLEYNR